MGLMAGTAVRLAIVGLPLVAVSCDNPLGQVAEGYQVASGYWHFHSPAGHSWIEDVNGTIIHPAPVNGREDTRYMIRVLETTPAFVCGNTFAVFDGSEAGYYLLDLSTGLISSGLSRDELNQAKRALGS